MIAPILVISAEKFTRSICSEALTKAAGYELEFVADAPDGLYALDDHRHRAALVEYDMDEMNGLEFLKRIRCGLSKAQRDLSVGMFAGGADDQLLAAAIGLDLNALMVPPISQKMIIQRTGRLVTTNIIPKPDEIYEAIQTPLSPRQIQTQTQPTDGSHMPQVVLPKDIRARLETGHKTHRKPGLITGGFGPRILRPVQDLWVGWQITDDVMGPNGVRLIGAGTVLTGHLVNRLRDLAADDAVRVVWARAPLPPK